MRRTKLDRIKFKLEETGIGKIILNNEKKRNILSSDVIKELNCAIEKVYSLGNEVKSLIICANNPEVFSAGGDVKEWYNFNKEIAYEKGYYGGKVLHNIEKLDIVTIAAISGKCLGGGNELALSCDYRIATKDSIFGQPEVILGNGLAWGGILSLS